MSEAAVVEATVPDENILRATAGGDARGLAVAIRRAVEAQTYPQIRAVGHGAVGQAVKAVAIARGWLASEGIDLAIIPGMINVPDRQDDTKEVTLVILNTFAR